MTKMRKASRNVCRFARMVSLFGLFAAIAGAQIGPNPMYCYDNVTATPVLRAEGLSEATGDITLTCTGGTTLASGSSVPLVNISIVYSTNVTSRLIPTAGSNSTSEALLLIDEPGSGLPGYGQSLPQILCTTPLTGCAASVGAVPGPTLNTAVVPGTSTPAPNVYQGAVSGNAVTFFGVPALPPGASAWRVFRITNVRLNAQLLAAGDAAPVVASIFTTLPQTNPTPTVGYVMSGLSAGAGAAANFSRYSSQTKTSAATLTFSEKYGNAFKTRVAAQSNNLYAGQINNPVQNIPGAVYNSESGFVLPINGTPAGLADFGTRLKATFNNVPAGVRVFVSTANVNSSDSPIAAPSPIGGSQANTGASGAYTGYAVLVNNETAIDGNAAAGAFPSVIATDSGPGSTGVVPIAEVAISNGTGSAVWEVVNTNPNTIETFKFAVYTSYTANPAQNSSDATTVNLSFAPSSTTSFAGDSGTPLPRFAPPSDSALPAFNLCTTSSCLTVASTHTGSFMQGQFGASYTVTVSNQVGANPTSGTVTVTETAPSGLTLVSMSGTGWACTTNVCTRNDALAGGASYPPIVVTVNVTAGSSSQVINQVTVSGGGSGTATASDPTPVITLASPALVISEAHANVFSQGQTGAAYTVTVGNHAGAGPTSGTVTVTDTVPAGLTLTLMYGSGWACAGNTCSRSDPLAGGASYPVITVIVNVAINAASPQVNAVSVSGGGALDAGATDSTVIVGGNLLTCISQVAVTPQLRGEGFTELTGDIAFTCAGGSPLAPGSAIPSVDITVTYNTNVTSRLLPRGAPQASAYTSEALLLIDEPGSGLSGYGPSLPQKLCTTPLTGCAASVGSVSGPTLGTAVSSGSTPAPNVYQGVVNGNSVTFFGVPVQPPPVSGYSRVFRITNVRVNAQPLAAGSQQGAMPVQASINVSNNASMPIVNPAQIVAYVSNGLSSSAGSAASLSQCSTQTKTSAATLTFVENFGTAFKTRVVPQSNTLFAGQINTPPQNIPGAIYNSDSGFVFPVSSTQAAGLSDYGTRFKATFNNVPAGVRIFVSTVNVNNAASPVAPPNPPGGMVVGTYAMLVNGETTSDGNAGSPSVFPGVAATDSGPNNGNVPIVELAISNGSASAVWEVVNTIPFYIESFKFAVYVTYTADPIHNSPAPGTATVHLNYAATAISGIAGDSSIPLPRFVPDSSGAASVFTIQACTITSSLGIATTHSGSFTQGQQGATYSVVVSNGPAVGPSSGGVTVTENLPAGLTLVSMSGPGWTCPGTAANNCTRSDVLPAGASYPALTVTVNVAANAGSPVLNSVTVSGGGSADSSAVDSTVINAGPPQALRFVPLTPCRITDTRTANGPFGGPNLAAGVSRDFNPVTSSCAVPANALAYSLNLTVIPLTPLGYISIWPTGQPQPVVSTLNSFDGRIKANAAIVPAGPSGAFTLYATDPTHVVVDINGYFVPASGSQDLAFYPVTPCRIADTRGATGKFGAPALAGGVPRTFPIPSSNCGIPAGAQAYAFNMTVVPRGSLGYLSTWPAGSPQPLVSTLNALTGAITSNASIVPAGVNGAISVYASDTTDLIVDINGYFAPPGSGALDFYTVTPCRALDTRSAAGALGGPIMGAGQSRSFIVPSSACGIPVTARAYSLNATVVPPAPLSYLTLWGSGGQPLVSTLNSLDGSVVANAALVPAGISGEVTAFTANLSHLLLDINGYFR